jgi:hypothetical protein
VLCDAYFTGCACLLRPALPALPAVVSRELLPVGFRSIGVSEIIRSDCADSLNLGDVWPVVLCEFDGSEKEFSPRCLDSGNERDVHISSRFENKIVDNLTILWGNRKVFRVQASQPNFTKNSETPDKA